MLSQRSPATTSEAPSRSHCDFRLSPPRHFVYPAILLLLAERPRHGYWLIESLASLAFGPADRPTVYRALADLKRDGLLTSWSAEPKAGSTRRVYAVSDEGRTALEEWMGVIGGERDRLDVMVGRYAALSDDVLTDEMLSDEMLSDELLPDEILSDEVLPDEELAVGPAQLASIPQVEHAVFTVLPERSAVLIRARSNVGPIEFGSTGLAGSVEAALSGQLIRTAGGVHGRLTVSVVTLTSGNSLYDTELRRRIDARGFPEAVLELNGADELGAEGRYEVRGHLTFHGVRRPLGGVVGVTMVAPNRMIVSGEQVIDIRDFDVAPPAMLMLKIYPDVRVCLQLEATTAG